VIYLGLFSPEGESLVFVCSKGRRGGSVQARMFLQEHILESLRSISPQMTGLVLEPSVPAGTFLTFGMCGMMNGVR
jgi:hypothetical protein